MPNKVKYNPTGNENAIFKGNWAIDTSPPNTGGGPSSITGFYNGADAPEGGYVIYEEGKVRTIADDTELIAYTNSKSGETEITTIAEALDWVAGQPNSIVTDREFENIVTDGLVLNLDAGKVSSYPKSGNTWYDLSGNGNNGTLVNGPTFDGGNDGSIVFDGSNDRVILNSTITFSSDFTFTFFGYLNVLPTPTSRQVYISGSNSWIEQSDRDTLFLVNTSPTQQSINLELPSNLLSQDTIYSISLVRKPNYTFDFYYNGILQTLRSSPTQTITQNFRFSDLSKSFRVFNGGMFIINLHNRALSATEVLQNFNATKDRFGL